MSKLEELHRRLVAQTVSDKVVWKHTSGGGYLSVFTAGTVKLDPIGDEKGIYRFTIYDKNSNVIDSINSWANEQWKNLLLQLVRTIGEKERERIDKQLDNFLTELT